MKKVYEEPMVSFEKYEIEENINGSGTDPLRNFEDGDGMDWEIPTDKTI